MPQCATPYYHWYMIIVPDSTVEYIIIKHQWIPPIRVHTYYISKVPTSTVCGSGSDVWASFSTERLWNCDCVSNRLGEICLYHVILLCTVEINDVMWNVITNPGETFRSNIAPESCFTTVCRDTNSHAYLSIIFIDYRQTSNVSRTIVGTDTVNHSDVVGASPVGAAPTTYSF